MDYGKFIVSGEDKKTLACIKNALVSKGYIFVGYTREPLNILRHVRNCAPDLVIMEAWGGLGDLRQVLEVLDEELLAGCILVLDTPNEDVFDLLRNSRTVSYMMKPVLDTAVQQVVDISLINYRRVLEYEQRIKKLNTTLEDRKVIEKAKWVLVEKDGFSEADAYEAIKKKSRDNRMPMREIAEAIILTRG